MIRAADWGLLLAGMLVAFYIATWARRWAKLAFFFVAAISGLSTYLFGIGNLVVLLGLDEVVAATGQYALMGAVGGTTGMAIYGLWIHTG
jgi:ABC-type antimicrobial peptide transport system permease subunit